jgi:hypothetical protein
MWRAVAGIQSQTASTQQDGHSSQGEFRNVLFMFSAQCTALKHGEAKRDACHGHGNIATANAMKRTRGMGHEYQMEGLR